MSIRSRSVWHRIVISTVAATFLSACASYGLNYLHPVGPRCAEHVVRQNPEVEADGSDSFTLISFNVKFGEHPDRASETLKQAGFDRVDVLVLQELDLPSARLIAQALGYDFVYFPSGIHPATERQFGLAILSPWPIRDDRKILLPWLESSDDARKIAVAATVWPQGRPVGVVNTHLQSGLTPVKTGDQLQAITGCAYEVNCPQAGAPMLGTWSHQILAGDLNTRTSDAVRVADEVLSWSGLRRVPGIGRTYKFPPFGFDHIYASHSLTVREAGVLSDVQGASDHLPIYAVLAFTEPHRDPWEGFDTGSGWETYLPPETTSCECPAGGCA